MHKLKILHITFDMGIGGTEKVIENLISASSHLVESEVLCIHGRIGETGQRLIGNNIKIHQLGSNRPGVNLSLVTKIAKLIRKENIDIVHCHQYTPFFYGAFAAILARRKYIFTEHGRHYPDKKRKKAYFINKVLFRLASANIAISESTKKAIISNEFCPENKVSVIYNGIPDTEINNLSLMEKRKFVCIARFDKNKNQEAIIRAAKILLDRNIDINVTFYGDGPEINNCISLSNSLDIAHSIKFEGFKQDPIKLSGTPVALILSSFTEGTSMVLLEAMARGIPCIASNVGGTPEIIEHGVNGILFNPENLEELATSMNELISDTRQWENIRLSARARFLEKFSSTKMAESYYEAYCEK